MRRNPVLILVSATVALGALAMSAAEPMHSAEKATKNAAAADEDDQAEKLLRHVVMFQFKQSATEQDVQAIEAAFAALPGKIKEIHDFEWGTNNSPENLADGFTHCFLVSFQSEEARAAYLPHPAHQEFVKLLRPHLEKVLVIDYWTQR